MYGICTFIEVSECIVSKAFSRMIDGEIHKAQVAAATRETEITEYRLDSRDRDGSLGR
jgi:hypothetical protein